MSSSRLNERLDRSPANRDHDHREGDRTFWVAVIALVLIAIIAILLIDILGQNSRQMTYGQRTNATAAEEQKPGQPPAFRGDVTPPQTTVSAYAKPATVTL